MTLSLLNFDNRIKKANYTLIKACNNTSGGYSLVYTTNNPVTDITDLITEYNKSGLCNIYKLNNIVEIATFHKHKNDKAIIKLLQPVKNYC